MNEPGGREHAFVWIASGLHRPWRVCSETETYAEFENHETAAAFLDLLVAGNPHLEKLS